MKFESKYISLGLAQRIAEAAKKMGMKLPESEVVYINGELRHPRQDNLYNPVNAYDTAELGEMLPYSAVSFGEKNDWHCRESYDNEVFPHGEDGKNEAEARGKMLEYLILNKLFK